MVYRRETAQLKAEVTWSKLTMTGRKGLNGRLDLLEEAGARARASAPAKSAKARVKEASPTKRKR